MYVIHNINTLVLVFWYIGRDKVMIFDYCRSTDKFANCLAFGSENDEVVDFMVYICPPLSLIQFDNSLFSPHMLVICGARRCRNDGNGWAGPALVS